MSTTLVQFAADVLPDAGDVFRFVYRFEGSSNPIKDTWPGAIWRQVNNDYRWSVLGYTTVLERREVVVDAKVEKLPADLSLANIEDMVSAVRLFSMSADTQAALVSMYAITPDEDTSESRRRSALETLTTSWGGPPPELVDDSTGPGVLQAATDAIFGAVDELFGRVGSAIGSGASGILGAPLWIVGLGAVAVYLLVNRKGG